MGNFCEDLSKNNSTIDVVFSIDKTVRDGRFFPQFKFKDIRISARVDEPLEQKIINN
jgi:hypothetical protein